MPRALFFGLTTVDLVFVIQGLPLEDSKNSATQSFYLAGGPATNAAITFASLGGQSQLVSALGSHSIAQIAHKDLASYNVPHMNLVSSSTYQPAVSSILINEVNGSRTIVTSKSIDQKEALTEEVRKELAREVLHADLFDGQIFEADLEIAETFLRAGKPVVLDGDLYTAGLEKLLPFVDCVIFGSNFKVDGADDSQSIAQWFQSFGIDRVSRTRGGDSIQVWEGSNYSEIDIEEIKPKDTLGAGDIFHGAFLFFYLTGCDFQRSLEKARDIATLSTKTYGTRDWIEHI